MLTTQPEVDVLTPEHRDFLIARHGTFELDPVPAMSDLDPLNWSTSKVSLQPKQNCCLYSLYVPR